MKVRATAIPGSDSAYSVIDEEPDELRRNLLGWFLADSERNEDLVLAELAKAEMGTPVIDVTNNCAYASMYPDGRVEITPREFLLAESEQESPPMVVITIAEARKLILDWLAAEKEWYAARDAQRLSQEQSVAEAAREVELDGTKG